MSEANVDVVCRCFDAWNRRDLDAWLAGWDERCNYRPAMEQAMAGEEDSYRGHEGLRRWWQEMSDAWSYLQSEVHEVRAVGDRVFVALTFRGKGGRVASRCTRRSFTRARSATERSCPAGTTPTAMEQSKTWG